jgi:hypothetical protein
MTTVRPNKANLERLLKLAQLYRGWTQKQLAAALDRDVHNLLPSGGVPRLDLVLSLSQALDWPVEDVIQSLCDPRQEESRGSDLRGAREKNLAAQRLLAESEYTSAFELACSVAEGAHPPCDRAYALLVACAAAEGVGRYSEGAALARRGLQLVDRSTPTGLWLRSNLANLYYCLGELSDAEAMATSLLVELREPPREDPRRQLAACALYARGNVFRVLAGGAAEQAISYCHRAIADLSQAADVLDDYQAHGGSPNEAAAAHTCRGGVVEMQAFLQLISTHAALDRCLTAIAEATDPQQVSPRWCESQAWWCIFGCNIALRGLPAGPDLERALAIFTNKADELAERCGNWTLREHVWRLEHLRRRELESASTAEPWVLDEADVRNLAGAMGRFPHFRRIGWQILRMVDHSGGAK